MRVSCVLHTTSRFVCLTASMFGMRQCPAPSKSQLVVLKLSVATQSTANGATPHLPLIRPTQLRPPREINAHRTVKQLGSRPGRGPLVGLCTAVNEQCPHRLNPHPTSTHTPCLTGPQHAPSHPRFTLSTACLQLSHTTLDRVVRHDPRLLASMLQPSCASPCRRCCWAWRRPTAPCCAEPACTGTAAAALWGGGRSMGYQE